jgi:hypothetical protein
LIRAFPCAALPCFALGLAVLGVIQFSFHFYGFKTYNVLVNPNNPIVQTVLTTMIESGDYFFFALDSNSSATTFRSEIGETNLRGLETNLPRIRRVSQRLQIKGRGAAC